MRYRFWFAICNLFNRKLMTCITIAMLTISFIVAANAGVIYFIFHYARFKAKDVITCEYDNVYNLNLSKYNMGFCSNEDTDRLIDFYYDIGNVDGIKYFGAFNEQQFEDDDIKVLFISNDLLQLCGIDETFSKKGRINAIAGADCRQDCEAECIKNLDLPITVNGIIKDAYFIGDAYFSGTDNTTLLDLNEYILVSLDDSIDYFNLYFLSALNNIYFVIEEDADINQIKNDVFALAKEHELDLYGITSMEEMFEKLSKSAFEDAGGRYLMPLIMLLCSGIAITVSIIYSMQSSRKDMGIMLSNGMTRMDLAWIFIFETIIKGILAFIFSIIYILIKLNTLDKASEYNQKELYHTLLPVYILFFLCITAFVSAIPFLYMRKQLPKDMIGEKI